MGKVLEIGISNTKGSQIERVKQAQALKGKGLVDDRIINEPIQAHKNHFLELKNLNINL